MRRRCHQLFSTFSEDVFLGKDDKLPTPRFTKFRGRLPLGLVCGELSYLSNISFSNLFIDRRFNGFLLGFDLPNHLLDTRSGLKFDQEVWKIPPVSPLGWVEIRDDEFFR